MCFAVTKICLKVSVPLTYLDYLVPSELLFWRDLSGFHRCILGLLSSIASLDGKNGSVVILNFNPAQVSFKYFKVETEAEALLGCTLFQDK